MPLYPSNHFTTRFLFKKLGGVNAFGLAAGRRLKRQPRRRSLTCALRGATENLEWAFNFRAKQQLGLQRKDFKQYFRLDTAVFFSSAALETRRVTPQDRRLELDQKIYRRPLMSATLESVSALKQDLVPALRRHRSIWSSLSQHSNYRYIRIIQHLFLFLLTLTS